MMVPKYNSGGTGDKAASKCKDKHWLWSWRRLSTTSQRTARTQEDEAMSQRTIGTQEIGTATSGMRGLDTQDEIRQGRSGCTTSGHANYHYALVAVDDFSSLIYMEPLCTKGAALTALRRCITRMEQAMDRKLKTLHSDNGGEWCSLGAEDWQTQEGFKWQKSVPGFSVQNGRAERAIRLVQEKMCSMLIGRACPRELWLYAITAVAHVCQRSRA
ncbi:uncharacterized protein UDID_19386 [Ustilago sp. UG-2017a]|nr:uncharacterized protein UDID_19386 [Ustilago sp. UG-2017a]